MLRANVKTLPLRQRRVARTKHEIQRCALELFRAHGFENTTVAQVAAAAEVSAMTVFRHFPTKEDLVVADDFDGVLVSRLREADPKQELVARITQVLLRSLATADDAARRNMYLRLDLASRTPSLRARMWEILQRTQEAIVDGVVREGADRFRASVVASACLAALSTAMFEWAAGGGEDDPTKWARRAFAAMGVRPDRRKK
jgi:AcrR family transcriptional regulator